MQLFLVGYILVEICEIFTVGMFPLNKDVIIVRLYNHLKQSVLTILGLYWNPSRINCSDFMDSNA